MRPPRNGAGSVGSSSDSAAFDDGINATDADAGYGLVQARSVERTPAEHRRLGGLDRATPVLLLGSIGIGLVIGLANPGVGSALSNWVAAGVFAMIYVVMLGVGVDGINAVFAERRFVAIAVGINFIVNPLLAWLLGRVFLVDATELRVGLLLFLVTPCIGWFLVFTDLAGGDTALGVAILGVNLVLQIALLPIYLAVFGAGAVGVPTSTILTSVVVYLVAPAALALVTRRFWPPPASDASGRSRSARLAVVKAALLTGVIVSMFASQAGVLVSNVSVLARLVIPLTVFFAVAFGLALVIGRRARLSPPQVALLAFTTSSRNSEASLAIAATAFANPLVAVVVVLGPIIELPLLVFMVYVLNRRRR